MKTRRLGETDLHLTEVGFGAWAIGGGDWQFGWGPQDDSEAIAAIRRALDLGVNWIDTAAIYGLGHSEEIVREAIKGRRDDVIIATKCSLVWDDRGNIRNDLSAKSVRRECEDSLRRLGVDVIDLYQLHWPSDDAHIEEGWETMARLVDEGKVRYAGVSNFDISQMERARSIFPIASLQPPYSLLRRDIEEQILPYCADNSIGVVAYSPMYSGLLTGRFDIDRLAENDWRRKDPEFQPPKLSVNEAFVEKLFSVTVRYGKTAAQLAIAWVLRRPEVTAAIVGARRPSQIEETVGGSGWTIGEDDLPMIEALLTDRRVELELKAAGGR